LPLSVSSHSAVFVREASDTYATAKGVLMAQRSPHQE